MPTFLKLPTEVIERTLTRTHPRDVAAFTATSRDAHGLVNQLGHSLWRDLDLEMFDDPRLNPIPYTEEDMARADWEQDVKDRMRAEQTPQDYIHNLSNVVDEAAPVDTYLPSKNTRWLHALVSKHDLDVPITSYACLTKRSPDLSRLLSVPGVLSYPSILNDSVLSRSLRVRAYNPSQVSHANLNGPFHYIQQNALPEDFDGPEVEWLQVEACIRSLWRRLFWYVDADPRRPWMQVVQPPRYLEMMRAYSAPGCIGRRGTRDWAGVVGRWVRITGVLDMDDQEEDLVDAVDAYEEAPNTAPSPDHYFAGPDAPEDGLAYAESQIWLVDEADTPGLPRDPFASYYHPLFPPIYFGGASRWADSNGDEEGGGEDPLSIRGRVVMYRNETVRWTIHLLQPTRNRNNQITGLEIEWVMEGVPLGHPCGAGAGIAGNWHRHQHSPERGDPIGPVWMWKVPDDAPRVWS